MNFRRRRNRKIDFDEFTLEYHQAFGVERPLESRNFIFPAIFFSFVALVAVMRVGYLAIWNHDYYTSRAESNVNRVIILPAERGIIMDRYGEPLVKNEPSLSVYLSAPVAIKNGELEAVYALVEKIGIDKNELSEIASRNDFGNAENILLKKDVSKSDAILIEGSGLESLAVQVDSKRVFTPEFAHIVGYTGFPTKEEIKTKDLHSVDFVGRTNLEFAFDNELRGEDGRIISYRNAEGAELGRRNFSDPKIGVDLQTTVDAGLNSFFYHRLGETLKNGSGPGGAGIVINPDSGEVLTLVSLPSFSSDGIGAALSDSDHPLFNRPVSGLYSPGSIIKTVVGVATLAEGVMRPDDEVLSTGKLLIPNKYNPDNPTRFVDWKPHGWVNLRSAIARSSNIYFYAAGGGLVQNPDLFHGWGGVVKGLGIERLRKYFSLFNLDQKTGIELSAESVGVIPSPEAKKKRTGIDWTIGDTYNTSIGQGDLAVTPVSLLSAVSSIVNGGKIYKLHLTPGESVVQRDNSDQKPAMDEVLSGMEDVVSESYGTANLLSYLPFKVVGKTGSAQVMNNKKTNAFFVGCADFSSPSSLPSRTGQSAVRDGEGALPTPDRICLLVLVENAKEGGLNAVPVAKDVFEWYYKNRISSSSVGPVPVSVIPAPARR